MKIVVAGCGIGGLSAAHALSQAGHQVVLLERAPLLKPVGAGIGIQPNALQAFKRLGLAEKIIAAGWPSSEARIVSPQGHSISGFDFNKFKDRLGYLPLTIFRGDLIRVLHDALDRNRIELRLAEPIESFESSDDCVVVHTSGTSIDCDGLVGADGVNSRVRAQLHGESPTNYAGYTCWRGMVEEPSVVDTVQTMTEVWGKGRRFGFMRCNERQVYWFATEQRRHRDEGEDNDSWKEAFANWIRPIPDLLEVTPSESIIQSDLADRRPIYPWGKGRVTLLGDAAHPMTPNFGQGGGQAIEDSVVLGMVIDQRPSLEDAFHIYEKLRHPRTSSMVKGSRSFGRIAQGANLFMRFVRNQVMPRLPEKMVRRQLFVQCDFEEWLKEALL